MQKFFPGMKKKTQKNFLLIFQVSFSCLIQFVVNLFWAENRLLNINFIKEKYIIKVIVFKIQNGLTIKSSEFEEDDHPAVHRYKLWL